MQNDEQEEQTLLTHIQNGERKKEREKNMQIHNFFPSNAEYMSKSLKLICIYNAWKNYHQSCGWRVSKILLKQHLRKCKELKFQLMFWDRFANVQLMFWDRFIHDQTCFSQAWKNIFSSKWHSSTCSAKLMHPPPCLSEVSTMLLLNQVECWSDWWRHFLHLSK